MRRIVDNTIARIVVVISNGKVDMSGFCLCSAYRVGVLGLILLLGSLGWYVLFTDVLWCIFVAFLLLLDDDGRPLFCLAVLCSD